IGEKGEDYKIALAEAEESSNSNKVKEEQENTSKKPEKKAKKDKKELPSDVSVIRMPLLSDTMKEGTIVAWLKSVGDAVAADEPIAEVETDKATMEVIPYVDGKLLHIGIEEGESVPVNDIIAIIAEKDHDIDALLEIIAEEGEEEDEIVVKETEQKSEKGDNKQSNDFATQEDEDDSRIKASPLARRMAKEEKIALKDVQGTGDGGRIVKKDIEKFIKEGGKKKAVKEASSSIKYRMEESYKDIPLTQMRKTVARRLSESKFEAPHFYLKMSIKMDNAMAARKAMNELSENKISFNDFIIKACAVALKRHPQVNSSWMGDFIRANHHVNIGTAVAVEEGLIVPVIKHADLKSLSQIAGESKELIQKARDKKLQPEEFTGNTFTVS